MIYERGWRTFPIRARRDSHEVSLGHCGDEEIRSLPISLLPRVAFKSPRRVHGTVLGFMSGSHFPSVT